MSQCRNCRAKLGCSCKKRTASDGKSCCATCLPKYEKTVKKSRSRTSKNMNTSPGVILNVTAVEKE
jgi:hypothetical protein